MAGKIIADTIEASGSQISLNVGNVTVLTASSTGLTLTPTSNVNINVANSNVTFTTANVTGVATFSAGSNTAPSITTSGDTNTGLYFPAADTVAFTEGGVESMRINSGGNLLVGTTANAIANAGKVIMAGGAAGFCAITNAINVGGGYYHIGFAADSTLTGSISGGVSSVSYSTTSDYRLKENIVSMTGALEKVVALRPVTYTWKATGEVSQGFIAHELQAVVPDCVTGEKDGVHENGMPHYQGVDTSFLVATLTAAIQELKAIVDAQAVEIAALKAK